MGTSVRVAAGYVRQRRTSPALLLPRRHRRRGGFTLVEMLVALTMGSLLVVSVVSATRGLSRSRASMERRVDRDAAARRAMETIVAGLRNVRRDPIKNEPVVVSESGGGGELGDRIDLLVIDPRRCRPEGAESDQYELSFFLSRPAGSELPVLMCRRDHALDKEPDDGGLVSVVEEGIVGLSFAYLSGERWLDEWSALEPGPPAAVRVTVAAADRPSPGAQGRVSVTTLSTVVALGVEVPATESGGQREGQAKQGERAR